jgi:hypothetical protein
MRKFAGVCLAAAMLVPVGLIAAAPAGAAAPKTTCKTASGTATFKPALPALGSKVTVKPTITVTGTLSGCTGGGVKSAKISAVLKQAIAGNCTTLLKGATANIAGSETLTWDTKATSTVKVLKLAGVTGKPTQTNATGAVTSGLFLKAKQTGTLNFTPLTGGCTTKPLSKVSFKQVTAFKLT